MRKREGNGGGSARARRTGNDAPKGRILERLVRSLAMETSIPQRLIPEVIEDLLGLISSELEGLAPDPDIEVALSPARLRERMLEWGYRETDLSEEDVDRILARLVSEMSRLGRAPAP